MQVHHQTGIAAKLDWGALRTRGTRPRYVTPSDIGATPASLEMETARRNASDDLAARLIAAVKRQLAEGWTGSLFFCVATGRIVQTADIRRPGLTCKFCGRACRNLATRHHVKVITNSVQSRDSFFKRDLMGTCPLEALKNRTSSCSTS